MIQSSKALLSKRPDTISPPVSENPMNCSYCGRENDATATRCCECGTEFAKAAASLPPIEKVPSPTQYLDITKISGGLDYVEGYHRPDWELIWKHICDRVPECDRSVAWNEATLQWVHRVRDDLGGGYHVRTSENFVLLCDLEKQAAQRLLIFLNEPFPRFLGHCRMSPGTMNSPERPS